jgi:hypothetical protein
MMTMVNGLLFLGFEVSASYAGELAALKPQFARLFINPDYLEEVTVGDRQYLGKFLTNQIDTAAVEQTSMHIYSLLKKLLPHHSYQQSTLWLLPLAQ